MKHWPIRISTAYSINQLDGVNIISSPRRLEVIDIIHDLGMRLCDLAHQDFIIHCKTVDDIFAAKKAPKDCYGICGGGSPLLLKTR